MKIIVAGGRTFTDQNMGFAYLSKLLKSENLCIISGDANGADTIGKNFAKTQNLDLIIVPAMWHVYGKSAGYHRNTIMASIADGLIAFWNGKSHGTKHMIDTMKSLGKRVIIVNYITGEILKG